MGIIIIEQSEARILKSRKGIQRKILVNTTLVALLLAAVLVSVMTYFMQSLTDTILLDTLQPMAKTAAQSVEGNLHMLGDRLFLLRESIFGNGYATIKEKQEAIDKAKSGIEFVWLGVYGPDGSLQTGSVDSPAGIAEREMFAQMQETSNLVISDTAVGTQGLEVAIGTPILDEEDVITAFLVGSYKYDVLNDVLSNINIGKSSTAFIIRPDGQIVAHQDRERVKNGESITGNYGDSEEMRSMVAEIVSGQTGSASLKGADGQRFFSYSPVRGTHWSLVITAPRSDFMGAANQAVVISIIITVVLLALAALFTVQMARKIQGPLGKVTGRIGQLAKGDLRTPVEVVHSKDETETLSLALSDTVQSINQYTSELFRVLSEVSNSNLNVTVEGEFDGDFVVMKDSLNQIVDFLNQIMRAIQNSSEQVFTTSSLVSQNAQMVQDSSDSQSSALVTLNAETQVIAENIDDISGHTETVDSLMQKAVGRLEDGQKHMQDMLNAMDDISRNSDEITGVNKILEDIAFQTNILALNASVEAARAGEAGRGFAVVADEVRNLAAKSGESSHRTAEMIDNSRRAIQNGADFAAQTAASMKDIMAISSEVAGIAKKLAVAVEAQQASLENMTGQITDISMLAQGNLDSSRTSTEASQTLTEQADTLQGMAKRFQIKNEQGRLLP